MLITMLLQYTFTTHGLPVIETYETMNYTENMVDCQMLGESEIAKIRQQPLDDMATRHIINIKHICLTDKQSADFWAEGLDKIQWRDK